MSNAYIYSGILTMAIFTYLIRVIPMVVFRRKITSRWIRSFLYYVPYTVLAAMTFPAVFSSTASHISSAIGCVAALILAYMRRGLLTVAVGAAAAAFFGEILIK